VDVLPTETPPLLLRLCGRRRSLFATTTLGRAARCCCRVRRYQKQVQKLALPVQALLVSILQLPRKTVRPDCVVDSVMIFAELVDWQDCPSCHLCVCLFSSSARAWSFSLKRVLLLFAADADHHRQGGPGMLPLLHQDSFSSPPGTRSCARTTPPTPAPSCDQSP
jgi:hypothetical protein